jgi:hypothetical protein
MHAMESPPRRSRLADIERLIVDGSNLLHALRRGAEPLPPATLIGRLRGVIEPAIRIELILDGPPQGSVGGSRIASGLTVRFSGRNSADFVIAGLVAEAANPATLLVVADDGELTARVRRSGARVARTEWLIARLERSKLASPSVGRPKPPPPAPGGPGGSPSTAADPDDAAPRWKPGRGATKKKGNPKRAPRAERAPD